MFELARDLHMPVHELVERVDVDEFGQWKALYRLEREQEGWSTTDQLLAVVAEQVSEGLLRLAYLQVGKQVPLPDRPLKIKRPGAVEVSDGLRDATRALAMFNKIGGG